LLIRYEEIAGKALSEKPSYYFKGLSELLTFLKNKYEWSMEEYKKSLDVKYSSPLKHAIDYMNKNFHDTELSVDSIAENVNLSVGRLSVLFKQETGKTINDYLTDIRIKHAIYLLRHTNLKIYEIGQRTGYRSSQYFSKVFNKRTGKRPVDFK
jgi:two-component system response regulator YesN